MLILGFPDSESEARSLAQALGCAVAMISCHRFPDGESLITLPPALPDRVLLLRSLHHPDDKLVQLMIAAKNARLLGASHLTLLAPYLCYMRQDKAFVPGQAVSQLIIGQWLAELFDAVLTVDPHLHRIANLQQAIPLAQAVSLSAAPRLGEFIRNRLPDNAILVGPDEESAQWVSEVARVCGLPFVVAKKERFGDTRVQVRLPEGDYQNKVVVMIDDVISSGQTMIETSRQALASGAREVWAVCTHALMAGAAEARMQAAGITRIYSSNSITHASNAIDLTPLYAEACVQQGF